MHRIDTATAQIDKFGQGKNGFTNGDPSTGRRATDLNSDMWDAVQEELANAIENSGLALDKNRHDQLYQAVKKIISDDINDRALLKGSNLSDLADKSASRNNLSVYSKTESDSAFVHKSGDRIQWMDVTDGLAVGKSIVASGDLTINGQDFITKRGNYTSPDNTSRQTNGVRINGVSDLFADIFHYEKVGHYHSLGIHVANGGAQGWFDFRNDGSFYAGNTVYAGSAQLMTDGNIFGNKWGGYLNDWLSREFNSRDSNINTRATVDYVNNEINGVNSKVDGRATWDYVNSRSNVWGGRGSWWHKDEVTGFITQGGVINRADYYTYVGFPRGFSRECFGVQLSLANSSGGWAGDSRVNIQPRDVGNNGFNVFMDSGEQAVFWEAKGV